MLKFERSENINNCETLQHLYRGQHCCHNTSHNNTHISMAGIACGFTHAGARRKSRDYYPCQTLIKIFDYIDTDNDGRIKADVFAAHLFSCGVKLSQADVEDMKGYSDAGGMISKTALQHFMVHSSIYKSLDEAKFQQLSAEIDKKKAAFHALDTNRDGLISKGEFGKAMRSLSSTQVDRVYDKYDKNKDQKLSEGEFSNMMILDLVKKHREKNNPKIIIS